MTSLKIAIIGAGSVGQTLGRQWADLGHQISFGVRKPEGAIVFKSLNQVGWEIMANPILEARRAAMFLAGPDGAEKQTVQDLIAQLGFEVLYIGDITLSRLLEPFAMTWIHTAMSMGMGRDWALSVVRR